LSSGDDFVAGLQDATGGGADVIIDPLWGEPALAAMKAARHGARHIQIGTMAGMDLALPAAAVRSKDIDLLGFAIFHAPLPVRKDADLQTRHRGRLGPSKGRRRHQTGTHPLKTVLRSRVRRSSSRPEVGAGGTATMPFS